MSNAAYKKYSPMVLSSEYIMDDAFRKKRAERLIPEVISRLEREDRIIWGMRILRMALTLEASPAYRDINTDSPMDLDNLSRSLQYKGYPRDARFVGRMRNKGAGLMVNLQGTASPALLTTGNMDRFLVKMQHFINTPSEEIQNYNLDWKSPLKVTTDLYEMETQWMKNGVGRSLKEYGTPIITFEDGSAWFDLERGGCKQEAEAMGHCGNGAGSEHETLLSYRKPVPGRPGQWAPHLTFVLNTNNGTLGEMKGRCNDLPAKRHHPAIKSLLTHDCIQSITGGGFMEENNFAINQMDIDDQIDIAKRKPQLCSLKNLYDLKTEHQEDLGFDLNSYAANILGKESGGAVKSRGEDGFYLETYGSLTDAAASFNAKNLLRTVLFFEEAKLMGMVKERDQEVTALSESIGNWMNNPDNRAMKSGLKEHLESNYGDFIKDNGINPDSPEGWVVIANQKAEGDFSRGLKSALHFAREEGAYQHLKQTINNSLEGLFKWPGARLEYAGEDGEVGLFVSSECFYEIVKYDAISYQKRISLGMSEREACANLAIWRLESINDLVKPKSGYSGYCEDRAQEEIGEMLEHLCPKPNIIPMQRNSVTPARSPNQDQEASMGL